MPMKHRLRKSSSILSDLPRWGPCCSILQAGGPLLRKELPNFLRVAKDCDMYVSTTTNGWYVRERIGEIAHSLDSALVSIDSPIREENDRIRGVRGAYDRAIEALKLFKEHSVPIMGAATLTRETLTWDRVEKFSKLTQELGIL